MLTTRIITFLGLGNERLPERYHRVQYAWNDQVCETSMHDALTINSVEDPCSIIVLGTEKVKEIWFQAPSLYTTIMQRDLNKGLPPLDLRIIPEGKSERDHWDIFNVITSLLTDTKIVFENPIQTDRHTESVPPNHLIIDITHGFRSQPLLATAAIAYAQSQRKRNQLPPLNIQIIYAAYEAGNTVQSVWDLTKFIEIFEWNNAIDSLMRFGRADEFAARLNVLQSQVSQNIKRGHRQGQAPENFPKLGQFAKSTQIFADSLVTARLPTLLTTAGPALAEKCSVCSSDVAKWIPPLEGQLRQLQTWANGLSANLPISEQGIEASLNLAELYLNLSRFTEAIGVLRELLVNAWTLVRLPFAKIVQPGGSPQSGTEARPSGSARKGHASQLAGEARPDTSNTNIDFKTQRDTMDRSLAAASEQAHFGIPKLFRGLREIRNDIHHCAMRATPSTGERLKVSVRSHYEQVASFLRSRSFVNCSNHPVGSWMAPQVEAAAAFGFGYPIDITGLFPNINPNSALEDMEQIAERVLNSLSALKPAIVFVAGELSLTFYLVKCLQMCGVRCVTALSERISNEVVLSPNVIEKTSKYQFVAWRDYPLLG